MVEEWECVVGYVLESRHEDFGVQSRRSCRYIFRRLGRVLRPWFETGVCTESEVDVEQELRIGEVLDDAGLS